MKKYPKPPLELVKDSMKEDLNSPLALKNFSFKNTFIGDWKNFLFFLFLMFMAWSYFYDTEQCRELIENKAQVCTEYLNNVIQNNQLNLDPNYYGETWEDNQPNLANIIPPDC